MLRPFLSLVVAVAGTVVGLSLVSIGASLRTDVLVRAEPDADAGPAVALTLVGVLVVGLATLSLAIHWVGAIVVGGIHALLSLLALVVPFGNPFAGGIFSPVFQITRMLTKVDPAIGDGATMFYFSGTALVVGAVLLGAALGIRSRRLGAPAGRKAVVIASGLGAVLLLAAGVLLVVGGGPFARMIFQSLRYDPGLASLGVVAGLLAGLGGLFLRWSSIGGFLAGGVILAAGIAGFLALGSVPLTFPGVFLVQYGFVMVAGVTILAAAFAGVVRRADEVPEHPDAL